MTEEQYQKYLIEFADDLKEAEDFAGEALSRQGKEAIIQMGLAIAQNKQIDSKPSSSIDEVEQALKVSLPEAYKSFLVENNHDETIWATDDIYGTDWIIAKLSSLMSPCWDGETPYAKWHTGLLSEIPLSNKRHSEIANSCVTIGKDQGGNFLLLDPSEEVLYSLCTDPMSLHKIVSGFSTWLKACTFED